MPRIGMNPSRNKTADHTPSRVTIAILTYVPHDAGYFEHRFDVLRVCLESLLSTNSAGNDVLVFDNGSSAAVVDYLKSIYQQNRIQYLLLSSRNIGKIDAFQMIFRSAPGEIVAYTDDDVLFLPGWLEEHLRIMEAYPSPSLVTGFYIRSQMAYSLSSTLKLARSNEVQCEEGDLWEPHWQQHYMENMGKSRERMEEENKNLVDIRLSRNGVLAMVSSGHHQFVAPRQLVIDALPAKWTGALMGRMRDFDEAIDKQGALRLNTPQPVTRLLGNVISAENAAIARGLGIKAEAPSVKGSQSSWMRRLARVPAVNRILRRIYHSLFRYLN